MDSAIAISTQIILHLPDSISSTSPITTVVGSAKSGSFGGGQARSHKGYFAVVFDAFNERKISSSRFSLGELA
jgi:hypothetical protein